jgi:hypothetical protein
MNAVDFAWQFDPLPTTRELTSGEIRQRAIIIGSSDECWQTAKSPLTSREKS